MCVCLWLELGHVLCWGRHGYILVGWKLRGLFLRSGRRIRDWNSFFLLLGILRMVRIGRFITWTDVDLSSVMSCSIHMTAISQEMLRISILDTNWRITNLRNCQWISVMCIDLWIFVWNYAQNTVFLHQLILDFIKYKYHNASFFSWLAKVIVFHGLAHLCLFTLYENWATVLVELLSCRWDAPVTSQTTFVQLCPSPVFVCIYLCILCHFLLFAMYS